MWYTQRIRYCRNKGGDRSQINQILNKIWACASYSRRLFIHEYQSCLVVECPLVRDWRLLLLDTKVHPCSLCTSELHLQSSSIWVIVISGWSGLCPRPTVAWFPCSNKGIYTFLLRLYKEQFGKLLEQCCAYSNSATPMSSECYPCNNVLEYQVECSEAHARAFRRDQGSRPGLFIFGFFLYSGVFPKSRSRKLPNLRVTWHFSLVQRRVKNGQTWTVKGMVKKWQNFISEVTNFSPWHPRRPWMYLNFIKIGRWCVLCRFAHVSLCQLLRRLW